MWHSDSIAAPGVVGRDDDLKALVAAYYRMVDADDIDGLVALFEPDLRYDRPGVGQIVGRAALERFYRAQEPVASRVHVISTCVREGRHLAAHGSAERTTLDGRQSTVHFADFFTVSDAGLFAYRRTFFYVPLASIVSSGDTDEIR